MAKEKIVKAIGRFGIGVNAREDSFLSFIQECLETKESCIVFDLSDIEFVYPVGIVTMTGLARYLNRYKNKEIRITLPKNDEVKTYLIESDYLKLGGIKLEPDESLTHNGNLMVKVKPLFRVDVFYCEKLLNLIRDKIEMSNSVYEELFESIMELQENVIQHSETKDGCFIMGQSFPGSQRVRISILDLGIGIKNHLSRKYINLREKEDYVSIINALERGITGAKDTSNNIGEGLYFIKQFVEKCNGCLTIISGRGIVVREKNIITRQEKLPFEFPGTIVDLTVSTYPKIKLFIKGEEIPPEYKLLED